MKEHYIILNFDSYVYVVKYICHKKFVSKNDIEDCAISYFDSDAYDEDNSYEDIINDIMSSFDGVEFEILNTSYIDMQWCHDNSR